jgi:DNA-binding cell septation regulator SpoVG
MNYPITLPGCLQIIEIRITLIPNKGKLKGFANITVLGGLALKGCKIIEGSNGLFAAMANSKVGEVYKDHFHMLTTEDNKALCDAIMAAYNEKVAATA